jgi:hypothetical protein
MRAQERFSWNERLLKRNAREALDKGVCIVDDVMYKQIYYRQAELNNSVPYIYKGIVYAFIDDKLSTVYPVNGRWA